MLTGKCHLNRRHTGILRVVTILIGFGCLVHMSHKNYTQNADKQFQGNALTDAIAGPNSGTTPSEEFHATAYCVTGITKSGVMAAPGHVAADPKVIPLGSMIYVDSPLMGGIYQVRDTGDLVKGKIIDIFIPSYESCKEFGRRMVKVKVLRYGFLGYPPENKQAK
jgi:3D (Asp-Asp-Asp) domain-containing protein